MAAMKKMGNIGISVSAWLANVKWHGVAWRQLIGGENNVAWRGVAA